MKGVQGVEDNSLHTGRDKENESGEGDKDEGDNKSEWEGNRGLFLDIGDMGGE
jgi:hypothetical protein